MLANDEDPLLNTVRICATVTLRLGLIQVFLGAAGLVFGAINELKLNDKTMFDGFDGSEYILIAASLVNFFSNNLCCWQGTFASLMVHGHFCMHVIL